MAQFRDYYQILQVSSRADAAIIKAAYYSQLKTNKKHPDLGGSHEEATLLNEAYEILSDPIKRKEYDQKFFRGSFKEGRKASPEKPYASPQEQRRVERIPFFKNFRWRPQEAKEWFLAQFRDISSLGACFRSQTIFKNGDVIEMDYIKGAAVKLLAKVRWVRTLPQRFGQPLYEGGVEFL